MEKDLKAQGITTKKKIYLRLMPILITAYIIAFIDRTNIGMAKETMQADIGLSATAYGIGAGLFFLTYAILEIPSNLILEKVGARFWITRIMITWGAISAAMAFAVGPKSFYILRLCLGAAEAGLYPGVIFYLTYWFSQEDRARATGLFLLGVCLANILGAPLSGWLLTLDGKMGFHGWQWMFVLEGIPAIFFAAVVWKMLPDRPEEAAWLNDDDKSYIQYRLSENRKKAASRDIKFSILRALSSRNFLMLVLIYFTHQFCVYGLSYFLPTIIKEYGELTSIEVGFLTAIPWVAAAFGGIFISYLARTPLLSSTILVLGYLIMAGGLTIGVMNLTNPALSLIGFSIAAMMFFVVQSIIFSIPPLMYEGSMLAGSIGLLNCLGLIGGFLGPYILGTFEDKTGTATSGLWFGIGLLVLGALISFVLNTGTSLFRTLVNAINRK